MIKLQQVRGTATATKTLLTHLLVAATTRDTVTR